MPVPDTRLQLLFSSKNHQLIMSESKNDKLPPQAVRIKRKRGADPLKGLCEYLMEARKWPG